MDPNLKHRLSSVANPNADYYRPDETRLAKDALAEINRLERERDDLRKALELLAVLGEQGMQRDYQRWLTFHDKVSEIARDALRSPEDKGEDDAGR